ncbi:MAG: hypothetical protein CVV21_05150 [Candidatus Goldiibacteriota bacterium HGW-Goldbacteria-1]|jgi:hypothetical protein|nr:MAG: hypothetical protein CVV21_05150 [Candidatus Goldiibacteriota bacterium HGW-Goldbacteria-1]
MFRKSGKKNKGVMIKLNIKKYFKYFVLLSLNFCLMHINVFADTGFAVLNSSTTVNSSISACTFYVNYTQAITVSISDKTQSVGLKMHLFVGGTEVANAIDSTTLIYSVNPSAITSCEVKVELLNAVQTEDIYDNTGVKTGTQPVACGFKINYEYPYDDINPISSISISGAYQYLGNNYYGSTQSFIFSWNASDDESGISSMGANIYNENTDTSFGNGDKTEAFPTTNYSAPGSNSASNTKTYSTLSMKNDLFCLSTNASDFAKASPNVYSSSTNLWIDSTSPRIVSISPLNGYTTADPNVTVICEVADDNNDYDSGIQNKSIALNSGSAVVTSGQSSIFNQNFVLSPGSNIVSISASDYSGNNLSQSFTYYFDAPPTISGLNPISDSINTIYSDSLNVSASITDAGGLPLNSVIINLYQDGILYSSQPIITGGALTSYSLNYSIYSIKRGTSLIEIVASDTKTTVKSSFTVIRKKKWTVIDYVCADNDPNLFTDITGFQHGAIFDNNGGMKVAGCDNNLDGIVYFDGNSTLHPEAAVYELKSGYMEKLDFDTTGILNIPNITNTGSRLNPELNSADYRILQRFIEFAFEKYPADHYMVIIACHGFSFIENLFDDDSGVYTGINNVSVALTNIKNIKNKKIDLIAFDSCLQSSFETAYQIKDAVDYMVGSENITYAGALNYKNLFNDFKTVINAFPDNQQAKEMAKQYVENFREGHELPYNNGTCAALDLNKMDDAKAKLTELAKELMTPEIYEYFYPEINSIKEEFALRFPFDENPEKRFFADLYKTTNQFQSLITGDITTSGLYTKCQNLINVMSPNDPNSLVFYKWDDPTISLIPADDLSDAGGITIYFPTDQKNYNHFIDWPQANYSLLKLTNDSDWDKFISKDITPPEISSVSISNSNLSTVGQPIIISYFVDENCEIEYKVTDSSGNEHLVQSFQAKTAGAQSFTWYGTFKDSSEQQQLLNNDVYQLRIQLKDAAGNYYKMPPGHGVKYYESSNINISIPRKTINFVAKTSPRVDSAISYIEVPNVLFTAKQYISALNSDIYVASGFSNNSILVPSVGTYQVAIAKQGYSTPTRPDLTMDSKADVSDYEILDFNPYLFNEANYDSSVDSDGDLMPDGWEFKCWKNWVGWTPADGCDLSKQKVPGIDINEATLDRDIPYKIASNKRPSLGDGLNALQECRIAHYSLLSAPSDEIEFKDLSPQYIDLLVEIDWMRFFYSATEYKYQITPLTKTYVTTLMENAGVKLHFASSQPATQISILPADGIKPDINISYLENSLNSSKFADYIKDGYNFSDRVMHIIFAPGWTNIVGTTSQGVNLKGAAGLYINNANAKGLYVFDLNTRNLYNKDGTTRINNTKDNPFINEWEGSVVAHEIGHGLGIDEETNPDNKQQNVMYTTASDSTFIFGEEQLHFWDSNIRDFNFQNLFSLPGYRTDHVSYKPLIYHIQPELYQPNNTRLTAFVLDNDENQNSPNLIRKIVYSINHEGTWGSWQIANLNYDDTSINYGDEYNYSFDLSGLGLNDNDSIKYYFYAADGQLPDTDFNEVTNPAGGNLSAEPATVYLLTIDNTPPNINFIASPTVFSPNSDGIQDKVLMTVIASDTNPSNLISSVSLVARKVGTTTNNETWPIRTDLSSGNSINYEWEPATADEGLYLLELTVLDVAYNSAVQTMTVVLDIQAPAINDVTVSTSSGDLTFAANDSNILIGYKIADSYSDNIKVDYNIYDTSKKYMFSTSETITPGLMNIKQIQWNGKDETGQFLPDGTYYLQISATDEAGNISIETTAVPVVIQRTPAIISNFIANPGVFSSTGIGGLNTNVSINYDLDKTATAVIEIRNSLNALVKVYSANSSMAGSFIWDGKDTSNNSVIDGKYYIKLTTTDNNLNQSVQTISIINNRIPTEIVLPASGTNGNIIIRGTALDPTVNDTGDFHSYELWYREGSITSWTGTDNPALISSLDWHRITVPVSQQEVDTFYPNSNISKVPVNNSIIGLWNTNTSSLINGSIYTILLVSKDSGGNISFDHKEFVYTDTVIDSSVPIISIQEPTNTAILSITSTLTTFDIKYILNSSGRSTYLSLDIMKLETTEEKEVVYHRVNADCSTDGTFVWDGRNTLGTDYVEAGNYRIKLTAMDNDGIGISTSYNDVIVQDNWIRPNTISSITASPNIALPAQSITINYQVSQDSSVLVKILDQNDSLISTLVPNIITDTSAQVTNWAGSAINGLYKCVITAESISDGSIATAQIPLIITNGTGGTTAVISSPSSGSIIQGKTLLNWNASANGLYYQPQDFTCSFTVNGEETTYPAHNNIYNWKIGLKSDIIYDKTVSGIQVGGSDVGIRDYSKMCIIEQDNQGKYTLFRKAMETRWIEVTVYYFDEYGNSVEYLEPYPTPSIYLSVDPNRGFVITEKGKDHFKAKTFVWADVHAATAGQCIVKPNEHVYDYFQISPSNINISYTVTGKTLMKEVISNKEITDYSAIPGAPSDINFIENIPAATSHNGQILTNATFGSTPIFVLAEAIGGTYYTGSADYDDNSVINTNISELVVTKTDDANYKIEGTLNSIDTTSPNAPTPWNQTFTIASSDTGKWIAADGLKKCFKNHQLTSVNLETIYSSILPAHNFTFSGTKYTNVNVSPNVSISLAGDYLTVSSDSSVNWDSTQDQSLNATAGNIINEGYVFNGNSNPNYFITKTQPIKYSDYYNNNDMSFADTMTNKYLYWYGSGTSPINNPLINIDANATPSWNVVAQYSDSQSINNDFEIDYNKSSIPNSNLTSLFNLPNDVDDIFTINMKNNSYPKRIEKIYGATSTLSDGFAGYKMFYKKAGSSVWNEIPKASTGPVSPGGVLAYWDVTELNGDYIVKLIVFDGSGSVETTQNYTVGQLASATASTIISAPCNKAYLTIPSGSLSSDTIITISAIRPEDSSVILDSLLPLPYGVMYKAQPEGLIFNTDNPATMSIRLLPGELDGYDPNSLNVYKVQSDGSMEIMGNIIRNTELSSDSTPVNITRLDFPVTHFTEFVVMSKMNAPVLNTINQAITSNIITLSGTSEVASKVEIFINDISAGYCTTNEAGSFAKDIELIPGENIITAKATRYVGKGYHTSDESESMTINYNTEIPKITISESSIKSGVEYITSASNIIFSTTNSNGQNGIKTYQYSVDNGTTWKNVDPTVSIFHLNENDMNASSDISLIYRVQYNNNAFSNTYTYINKIHIGFEIVNDYWADWAYKVSDTEIWFSGGRKSKYDETINLGLRYPQLYYSDVLRFNGQSFESIALNETKVVPDNNYNYPNNNQYRRRFVVALNKEIFSPYQKWDKKNNLIDYPFNTINNAEEQIDICYNKYYIENINHEQAIISKNDGSILILNDDLTSSTYNVTNNKLNKVKLGGDGFYYVVGDVGTVLRNGTQLSPDQKTNLTYWSQIGSSITESELTDIHIFADNTGWAIGKGGTIKYFSMDNTGNISNVIDYSISSEFNGSLNAIYMKDKKHGWIAADQGKILVWDSNQNKWIVTITPTNLNLQFVVADNNNIFAGSGKITKDEISGAITFNQNENVLIRSSNYKTYIPVERPKGLEIESDPKSIKLSWKKATGNNEYQILSYNVYQGNYTSESAINNVQFVKIASTTNNQFIVNFSTNEDTTKYIYAVDAVYGNGSGIAGETYYSNEGFGTPKGSIWKTVGTDLYPGWKFHFGNNEKTVGLDSLNPQRKIHSKYYAGTLNIMTFNSNEQMWQSLDISHPYSFDFVQSLSSYAGVNSIGSFDIDQNGNMIAVAKMNQNTTGINNELWEYNELTGWQKANTVNHCIGLNNTSSTGCGDEIFDVIGGTSNIWILGNASGVSKPFLGKYLGNGSWYQKSISDVTLTALKSNTFIMKNNSTGWGTYNYPKILYNNSLISVPGQTFFNLNGIGIHKNNLNHLNFKQINFTNLNDNMSLNGWAVFSHDKNENIETNKHLGFARWNGNNWNIEYIDSSETTNNSIINGIKDISMVNSQEGYALLTGSNSAIFNYNGNSWIKSSLPGSLELYSSSQINGEQEKPVWIAASNAQILAKRSVNTQPAAPTNVLASSSTESTYQTDNYYTRIEWTASVGDTNSPKISGYNIYRKYENNDYVYVGTTDVSNNFFEDDRFMDFNGNYYYKVKTFNNYGIESEYSSSAEVYVNFLTNPIITPTVTATPIISPTPTLTPLNELVHSWQQYGYDTRNSYGSHNSGYSETSMILAYNFYAPDRIYNILSDKYSNTYAFTGDELQDYIIQLSPDGEVNSIVERGLTSNMVLGNNDHLYYTTFDPNPELTPGVVATPSNLFKARNILTGEVVWQVGGGGYLNHDTKVDGEYVYHLDAGSIRKYKDVQISGQTFQLQEQWPADIKLGNAVCNNHTGKNYIVDDNGYIYFVEPSTLGGCYPGNWGLRIVKYPPSGSMPNATPTPGYSTQPMAFLNLDEIMNVTYFSDWSNVKLLYDSRYNKIYIRYEDKNTHELRYIVVTDDLKYFDKFGTGIINASDSYYPIGALNNGYFYFIGTNNFSLSGNSADNKYIYRYKPVTADQEHNNLISNHIANIGPGNRFSNFVIDKNIRIFIGTPNSIYIFNNALHLQRQYNISGEKQELIIGNDSRMYCNVGNNELLGIGTGKPIPTPPAQTTQIVMPSTSINYLENSVSISWQPITGATGYYLYQSGSPFHLLNEEVITDTSYTVINLIPGNRYSFIITSVDAYDRESEPSDLLTFVYGTPTPTQTITATCTQTMTSTLTPTSTQGTHKLNLQVANVDTTNDCSANYSTSKEMWYNFKIVNNDSVSVNIKNLKIKIWIYNTQNILSNGFYGGEIKDQSDSWRTNVNADIIVDNSHSSNICFSGDTRKANRTATLIFTTDFNIPPGGFAQSLDGKLYINGWIDPFDLNCDDYSKLPDSTAYINESHFTLYENDMLVTEWADPDDIDQQSGQEPCIVLPTNTITNTASITATPSLTVSPSNTSTATMTPIASNTASMTITDTSTASPTNSDTNTVSPTLTITETMTNTMIASPTATATVTLTVTPVDYISEGVDNNTEFITGLSKWLFTTDQFAPIIDNTDSVKSAKIRDHEISYFETEVNNIDSIKFYWKISSEQNYDYLRFLIDGNVMAQISGETVWEQVIKDITAGRHILRWEYSKDGSGFSGTDSGWVDSIEYIKITPTITVTSTGSNTPVVTVTETSTETATMTITSTNSETATTTATSTITQTDTISPTITITRTPLIDNYEYDDDYTQADIITSSQVQTHSISPLGDIDWVKILVSYRSKVTIETSGLENSDTVIGLYSNDDLINPIESNDDNGDSYFSKIDTYLEPGVYFVKLGAYENLNEIDQYSVSILMDPVYTATSTVSITPTITQTFITESSSTETITPSITYTYSFEPSLTQTLSVTSTLTPSATITSTNSITNIQLQHANENITLNTQEPQPKFILKNNGSNSISLSDVEIRYFYQKEGSVPELTDLNWASRSNVNLDIISGDFGGNQNSYLKITFDSGAGYLENNETVEIKSRFHKNDWSQYDQGNDYSFRNSNIYADWSYVCVYLQGSLVWGNEPTSGFASLSSKKITLEKGDSLSKKNAYNYPNPCKKDTIIRFSLSGKEEVNLKILDIKGTTVWNKKIMKDSVKIGINQYLWNLKNSSEIPVSNGVYLLKISTDAIEITKKIVVVR